MKWTIAVAVIAASLLSVPALAQEQAPEAWRQVAIAGGCTVAIPSESSFPSNVVVSWDHACAAGQPISGEGVLRMTTADGRAVTMEGTWVSGVPNGTVVLTGYDTTGAARMQRSDQYNMGCQIADGVVCSPYQPG